MNILRGYFTNIDFRHADYEISTWKIRLDDYSLLNIIIEILLSPPERRQMSTLGRF